MIPKRYLFASMFIAAMLMLLAIVQAPRSTREGGAVVESAAVEQSLQTFETLAEYRLLDGWAPRFQGAVDPDQEQPWPYGGGFGSPWEPASAYLTDQGLALNGPGGRSEIILWKGLEWRHYRFDAPIASARLDPLRGSRLLVTLSAGPGRFETRLMEVPEGRVLWATDSGPWSRFSWDGKAVLIGLKPPQGEAGLLLATLPLEPELPPATLAPWDEKGLPPAPRGWPVRQDHLWDDGKDLPGARVMVPWQAGGRLWFPQQDRLWVSAGGQWTLWVLESGVWKRSAAGAGTLQALPPRRMGLLGPERKGEPAPRSVTPADRAEWEKVDPSLAAWPANDPAWLWFGDGAAATAWDQRWGGETPDLPRERQREALLKAFRPEWRTALGLRASVKGWIPEGPEIALREAWEVGWVWVGDRAILVRLQPTARLRTVRSALKR
ncbi:hypothetical protein [Mesoterricola sediminis]|uniref:Uncharacterized protein n=1 Tax=Mesoterricola sediminis TaxID=2927980 RepID=A0AA48H1K1_9BACT|nr:hypothetical protein [Mesoterricola sediminis]BDU78315.1 hypothetical protein METESE_32730 [Mesoterricola sediminis]